MTATNCSAADILFRLAKICVMKKIILWLAFCAIAFACSGDCASCHTFTKDAEHTVLNECVSCHASITSEDAECGGNCFSCHSPARINKQIVEHQTLEGCKNCHISSERGDFMNNLFNFDKSLDKTLEKALNSESKDK